MVSKHSIQIFYSRHSIMNFTHGGLVNSVGYYLQNVIEICEKKIQNDENVTFLKKKYQIGDKSILNLISRKY